MQANLETTRLYYKARSGKLLCNGLYVRAEHGTITAIMGPAGCGKSVLLRLLTGYDRPLKGRVLIGEHDVHAAYGAVRNLIGYVPQAEVMIAELEVGRSLDYRLQLRAPGTGRAERERLIRETCAGLGLSNVDELLRKRIGTPESRGSYPSGGERRRVNIAHELLSQPRVLFLDEPTSGLSSIDADGIILLLRDLARKDMTILLTIHQPSRSAFECFDNLLLLNRGGFLCYYGKAQRAVDYLEESTGVKFREGQNPAEYLLEFVRDPQIGKQLGVKYEDDVKTGRYPYLEGFEPLGGWS